MTDPPPPPPLIEFPDWFRFTLGWWHNAYVSACTPACSSSRDGGVSGPCGHRPGGWTKHITHTGSYDLFTPGEVARYPGRSPGTCGEANRRAGRWEGHDDYGHQAAIILGRRFGCFVVDVDNAELYEAEALLSRFVTWGDRISSSRVGHWHALVVVPPELAAEAGAWPARGVPGADLKGSGPGFVPVPGCVHYSGSLYEPPERSRAIVATREMLDCIRAQPVTPEAAEAGYTGGSADGRQGVLLRELMGYPVDIGEAEARGRWLARYDELSRMPGKDHDISPESPEAHFERQWAWRRRNLTATEAQLSTVRSWRKPWARRWQR